MSTSVRSIAALGLYGRFDIHQRFESGVNILYGRNGTGKTTLLHILANALNGDFKRFAFLDFDKITIELDDNSEVLLARIRDPESDLITVDSPDGAKTLIRVAEIHKAEQEKLRETRYDAERLLARASQEPPVTVPILSAAYFPAFRTMLEAWASVRGERYLARRQGPAPDFEQITSLARELFGQFVPGIGYPSLPQIEFSLSEEVFEAWRKVSAVDRELLSSAFLRIFASISAATDEPSDKPEQLLQDIRGLTERIETTPFEDKTGPTTDVYSQLRDMLNSAKVGVVPEATAARVLNVYRDSLASLNSAKTKAYEGIATYLMSVNEFLEGKVVYFTATLPTYRGIAVGIRFEDGATSRGLKVLSSGERQIASLIYASTHMSKQSVVLIDEPEISLHVDWQRLLIKKMMEQLGERQIIACTHSPVVGADFESRLTELHLTPTAQPRTPPEPTDEEPAG